MALYPRSLTRSMRERQTGSVLVGMRIGIAAVLGVRPCAICSRILGRGQLAVGHVFAYAPELDRRYSWWGVRCVSCAKLDEHKQMKYLGAYENWRRDVSLG